MKFLELLAPARDFISAVAAVDHGADAIYIGGHGFGARQAASNSIEDIARTVEYAHPYGVRVYATFNTVIFDHELDTAHRIAKELVAAGVDALIIQDLAVARMGLDIELHASTQMSNMSVEHVLFLEKLGISRVVLERALSQRQILDITHSTNVDIEAFVHGAICVGHSGRCLLSRSMSQRSGNRGECSQPCRLRYDLYTESGECVIAEKHLLSVKDLNLTHRLGELIDAGVSSFKIEGRLKDVSYTKNIVTHYRHVLDNAISQREGYARSSQGISHVGFIPNPSKSFSREGSEYLFDGQTRNLATFDTPKSMGERLGQVVELQRGGAFRLDSNEPLCSGDGICFMSNGTLRGTNINRTSDGWIYPNRAEGIERGMAIFRNFDKSFFDILERSRARRKIEIKAQIIITESRVTLRYVDCQSIEATTTIEHQAAKASSPEKMRTTVESQLSKCGDTIFTVTTIDIADGALSYFIPSSVLAALRRQTLIRLHTKRLESIPMGGKHFKESQEAKYPYTHVTADEAVTNHLSQELYRDHGAQSVERSWESQGSIEGAKLMDSSYCLRNEIGECLKESTRLKGKLYLHHGAYRYRLEFDCSECRMSIYKA